MTEQQVVEWSILIGNDYTGTFPRSLFGHGALPEGHSLETLEDLRRAIVFSSRCLCTSSCEPLQRAIEYSRANCALQDLRTFEAVSDGGDGEQSEIGKLTDADQAAVKRFMDCSTNSTSVVHSVMAFLRSSDCKMVTPKPEQLVAVRRMLGALQGVEHTDRGRDRGRGRDPDSSMGECLPLWEDVYFALAYQLICKEMLAARVSVNGAGRSEGGGEGEGEGVCVDPQRLFDGALFHSAVARARSEAAAVSHPSSPAPTTTSKPPPSRSTTSAASVTVATATATSTVAVAADRMPIEDHRELILRTVGAHRVTVIEGETGWYARPPFPPLTSHLAPTTSSSSHLAPTTTHPHPLVSHLPPITRHLSSHELTHHH